MKWFRMYHSILDSVKVRSLSESSQLLYIYLLCAAGERREVTGINDGSTGLTEVQARFRLRLPYVKRQLASLVEANLVRSIDDVIVVSDWEDKQRQSDDAAARKRKSRDTSRDTSQLCPVLDTDTDTDTSITPTDVGVVPAVPARTCPPCPFDSIVSLYHDALPANPRVIALNEFRRGLMRSRWRECYERRVKRGDPAESGHLLDWFASFFDDVAKSDFLTGKSAPREGRAPFVADLEFLFRPKNFLSILEGKYA